MTSTKREVLKLPIIGQLTIQEHIEEVAKSGSEEDGESDTLTLVSSACAKSLTSTLSSIDGESITSNLSESSEPILEDRCSRSEHISRLSLLSGSSWSDSEDEEELKHR